MSLPLPMAIPLVSLMFVPALQPLQTSKMRQISVKNAAATVVIVAPYDFCRFCCRRRWCCCNGTNSATTTKYNGVMK